MVLSTHLKKRFEKKGGIKWFSLSTHLKQRREKKEGVKWCSLI